MIDKSKVTHDLVHRYLHGNSGKEGCEQEQAADQSVAGKLEPVQYICDHRACQDRTGQYKYQDDR